MDNKTMLTDLYQLTMNAAYYDNDKNTEATFDLFIRKLPTDWGYYVAGGIEEAIDYLTDVKFEKEDIEYLRSKNLFSDEFLENLRDFRFEGEVYSVKEGTPIFPNEPIMRVTARRDQAQFVETALLNIINYQTMIASKASRVVNSAGDAKVVDFGLRRAQGEDAGMKGARAAFIGGAVATSNVKAGMEYDIPISGTHAHSFVMSFPDELDAFRAYVKTFPDNATLLIDTYDTANGARNAAIVAKELEKKGKRLGAVRLDSGDLGDLSLIVREILDERGLDYVKILASNDLNEYKIDEFRKNGAEIDGYGVGTELITAKPVAAIPGVYKLVEDDYGAKIKLSSGKMTLPGKKNIFRRYENGEYVRDIIALDNEKISGTPLLEKVIEDGERISERMNVKDIRSYSMSEVSKLPEYLKDVRVKESYPVSTTVQLNGLVQDLSMKYGKEMAIAK